MTKRYKCTHCGREFHARIAHKCNGVFRKKHLSWDELSLDCILPEPSEEFKAARERWVDEMAYTIETMGLPNVAPISCFDTMYKDDMIQQTKQATQILKEIKDMKKKEKQEDPKFKVGDKVMIKADCIAKSAPWCLDRVGNIFVIMSLSEGYAKIIETISPKDQKEINISTDNIELFDLQELLNQMSIDTFDMNQKHYESERKRRAEKEERENKLTKIIKWFDKYGDAVDKGELYSKYGWIPLNNILNDLEDLYNDGKVEFNDNTEQWLKDSEKRLREEFIKFYPKCGLSSPIELMSEETAQEWDNVCTRMREHFNKEDIFTMPDTTLFLNAIDRLKAKQEAQKKEDKKEINYTHRRTGVPFELNELLEFKRRMENGDIDPRLCQVAGSHYSDMAIQPMEFALKNGLNYAEANVVKYICRHRKKNGKEDLLKAIHNIELLIEHEYGDK